MQALKYFLVTTLVAFSLNSYAKNTKLDNIPCPENWVVEVNPVIDNSVTYTHNSKALSVNVTYISDNISKSATPESFARVSALQLNCSIPVQSNLIKKAWSYYCDDFESEVITYGDTGDLVMLTIAGRSPKTEDTLEGFIRFLNSQSNF